MNLHSREVRRGAAGFSMIELTAALFVLAVGMMGTLQMYNVLADKTRVLQESEIAVRAVNTEIETLRALPFAQLTDREDAPFVSELFGTDNLVNVTPRVTVRPYADTRLELKEVTATLQWTGEHGRKLEKSATTLIAEKGQQWIR